MQELGKQSEVMVRMVRKGWWEKGYKGFYVGKVLFRECVVRVIHIERRYILRGVIAMIYIERGYVLPFHEPPVPTLDFLLPWRVALGLTPLALVSTPLARVALRPAFSRILFVRG